MTKALIATLLTCFTLFGIPAVSLAGAEKDIADLENQWVKAEQMNTPDTYAPLLADDYVATMADGSLQTKAETLESAKGIHYTSTKLKDVKVTVYGDAAVATGEYLASGTVPGKTATEHEHFRWTDTWIRSGGQWKVVASQYTTIKSQPKPKS